MKFRFFLLFFCINSTFCFSQAEASVWYFGENAGIKFHPDGSVTALVDGKLNTLEGCATLSDTNGDLMFYTDGITIYNKNHQVMLNGTGLKGHASSTQSATIVQKPGSSNLFYVFTTDAAAKANGLMYSEIDLNLDGGLGAVTTLKNIPVYSPTCEKLTIVKHSNNVDYWIITHGWESNTFYAHLFTSSGLSATPILSNSGIIVDKNRDNTFGYMKVSPNGKRISLCHQFLTSVELFDFDNSTGIISNPKVINNGNQPYGTEFSSNSEVLYISLQIASQIFQYDLNATDIKSTEKLIAKTPSFLGALQLGPNNKIYIANYNSTNLGVINDPNILGLGCDLQAAGVNLSGKKSMLGLPAFNQSFFNPSFNVKNLCLGEESKFTLGPGPDVTALFWDFGDGTSSNQISPTHNYTMPGKYTVKVTATSSQGVNVKSKDIVISKVPTAAKPQAILVCDDNNDGFYIFDLTTQDATILNGQDPQLYGITYFVNNTAIALPYSYVNKTPYGEEIITAEVYNKANGECKSTTSFSIDVFDTPTPNLSINILDLTSCDNITVGSDRDGKILFDLTLRETSILNGQLPSQFLLSYYTDANFTQLIALPKAYQNTNATETIFVKVANKDNAKCTASTSFKLEVFPLPVISNVVSLKQCDDDIDGFSSFNLEEAITKITANSAVETITFHKSLADAQNNNNAILNQTAYRNQTVSTDKVYVRIVNNNNCYRTAQINLIVSTTQIPVTYSKTLIQCDDEVLGTNKDGIALFDLNSVTNDVVKIFPVGQLLDITYYQNIEDALSEKNAIADISNYRNTASPYTQKIFIRVDSRLNNDCLGLGGYITLKVEPIPFIKAIQRIHCDDNQDGLYAFDTTNLEQDLLHGLTNVSVAYIDQNNSPLPSPLPNPFITYSQIIKVVVTNNTPSLCSFDSTISFIVSDLPEAFPIDPRLFTVCDDEDDPLLQDGKYAFDTSTFETALLGTQTGMIVNYYDNNNNPLPSPLPNPFVTGSQNVKVEVVNPNNTNCTASAVIAFVVNPVPKINLNGEELVCSNLPTFTKQIDAGLLDLKTMNDYNYQWSFNGNLITAETNYNLTVNQEGIFTVEVRDKQTQCARIRTIKVSASDIASNIIAVVDESNTISISVTGNGDYVYALDDQNGYYQNEKAFLNVRAGIHTVYIKDQNGCGTVSKEVAVFGIPKFFTPNQDSHNDYWNVEGIQEVSDSKTIIQIFDRYGKLIKQISPMSQGWDGTYLGTNMPAADYWYVIKLEDNRIFKGHFALKR
ncbi:T9SS type B sorting domain-containing protein [Flavobacterium sp. ASV13]|uniref:T9SS type B sorting domain-containing protein n=1 Tax=Flavobacterium sp. ASV13 TaxID=1506583 RepID=UPI000555ABE0|nr:T9SS type B sorting domain-containing protein [Flavobacterium sp. ASV13]